MNLLKYYWEIFTIILLKLFLVYWMLALSKCASMHTENIEGHNIGIYKGVSNVEILQLSASADGRSAKAELITFHVPYERLPILAKVIIDANGWYKDGDMVTIRFKNSTSESWIYTPSSQWHKVK